jgi:hypothetical protein
MLEHLRFHRTLLARTISYVEEFYAVLRFIDRERFHLLLGYEGAEDACRDSGWVEGHDNQRPLTDVGRAAHETELADRERRGLSADPDPFLPLRVQELARRAA